MSLRKKRTIRILAAVFILMGIALGFTWNSTGFCIGDNIFAALGLPAWSKGTTGTHYPAIVGTCFILAGVCLINYTLKEKTRSWIWAAVVIALGILNAAVGYIN